MREIKFRAWNRKRQSMSYDDIYPEASQDWDLWEQSLHCMLHAVEADHVLMQFTGLRDKNGKEIYEGDILECISDIVKISTGEKTGKQSRKVCSVVYVPEQAHFTTQRPSGHIETGFGITQAIIGKWYEVIGNIWEHKHLLEKDNDR